jgi:RHS repeat-associated protein
VIEGGVTSLVRIDHIGRPVFATNTTGVKVWTASYTPFGGVRTTTGTPVNARFPGQWFQAESGLHQNWMRDYDPTTGRYLQADPLGLVDGASVYGYARQSPMMYTDPRGLAVAVLPQSRPGSSENDPILCDGVVHTCTIDNEQRLGGAMSGYSSCNYKCTDGRTRSYLAATGTCKAFLGANDAKFGNSRMTPSPIVPNLPPVILDPPVFPFWPPVRFRFGGGGR